MLLSSILLITMPSWACLNTYVEDFYTSDSQKENQLEEDHDEKLNNFVSRHPSPIDYQAEIDFAVHQIHAGRHDLAIMVLSEMRMPDSGLIGIKLIRRGWREICVSIDTRILPDRAANCRMRTAD